MKFEPNSVATAIGSFPHQNVDDAGKLIFESIPSIPVWPQLPKRSFLEDMNNQYSRSLPCYVIDDNNNKSGFDTSRDLPKELETFYSKVIEDDLEYFGLDENHSVGFSYFLKNALNENTGKLLALKGQVTGPLTLGLVTDTDGKYAFYKSDLFDTIVKNSAMNARWQIRKLREIFPQVIIFIDEPSLSIIGSGFYSIENSLVINSFNEIIKGIRDEGGIPGMHCCGNADWDELLNLDLDIINFDATDEIVVDKFLNSVNIIEYLEKGKCIAWGIVPTIIDKIENATFEEIEQNFYSMITRLSEKGIKEEDILTNSIITPSCGTGTLTIPLAEKALILTGNLSDSVRGKRG